MAVAIRDIFSVVPDDILRETVRTSMNRMPVISDWTPGEPFTNVLRELGQPICIHRKAWEYAICITGMTSLGLVTAEGSAVATGAGTEPPLYYFANRMTRVVATDIYDASHDEGRPKMLTSPESFAPFAYEKDHLEVYRMPGDKLDFPDGTFDFAFCLSSIEHFGSRETIRAALDEMRRVIRQDGVLCIITELILTDHTDPEFFTWEEINSIFIEHPGLRLVGGPPDLTMAQSHVAYPTDIANSVHLGASPHIILKRGDMLWTSFSMFLQKV